METTLARFNPESDSDTVIDNHHHMVRVPHQELSRNTIPLVGITNSAASTVNINNISTLPLPAQINILQSALRDTQLTAMKLQAGVRTEVRRGSSLSAVPAPSSTVSALPLGTNNKDGWIKEELKAICKQIFILGSPWPVWSILGSFIAECPTDVDQDRPQTGVILSANDAIGDQILSLVPQRFHQQFLSLPGQRLVSGTMRRVRSSYIHRLRSAGNKIFGFDGNFFNSKFDHSVVSEFQALLGVKDTPRGKRYPLLPPILYPEESGMDPKQLFMHPAVVKILKVILFGPASLGDKPVCSPKPIGQKWGLQSVTPEAIALAAMLARFLLSPDQDFSVQGAQMHIHYLKAFRTYRDMIIEETRAPTSNNILNSFNKLLFGSSTHTPVSNTVCGGDGESEEELEEYCSRLKNFTAPFSDPPNVDKNAPREESAANPPSPTPHSSTPLFIAPENILETEEDHTKPKKRPAPKKKQKKVVEQTSGDDVPARRLRDRG